MQTKFASSFIFVFIVVQYFISIAQFSSALRSIHQLHLRAH